MSISGTVQKIITPGGLDNLGKGLTTLGRWTFGYTGLALSQGWGSVQNFADGNEANNGDYWDTFVSAVSGKAFFSSKEESNSAAAQTGLTINTVVGALVSFYSSKIAMVYEGAQAGIAACKGDWQHFREKMYLVGFNALGLEGLRKIFQPMAQTVKLQLLGKAGTVVGAKITPIGAKEVVTISNAAHSADIIAKNKQIISESVGLASGGAGQWYATVKGILSRNIVQPFKSGSLKAVTTG